MILEAVSLNIIPNTAEEFEQNFVQASAIICKARGYVSHQLQKCIEVENKYLLLIKWETLEDHTIGFRESSDFQEWRKLLHHFYEPKPIVEHYHQVYKNDK